MAALAVLTPEAGAGIPAAAAVGDDSDPLAIDPSLERPVGPVDLALLGGGALWLGVAGWLITRRRLWRLPAAELAPEQRRPVGLILIAGAALVWLAAQLGAASAFALTGAFGLGPGPEPDGSLWGDALLLCGMYAGGALALALLLAQQPLLARVGGLIPRARDLPLGAGGLLLALPFVLLVNVGATAIVRSITGEPTDPLTHETLRQLAAAERLLPVLIVSLCVCTLTPALEEVIYRGLGQTGLRALTGSPWAAVLITSVVFAWMHVGAVRGSEHALVGLLALSIALGILRERTGSVGAPIVAHALFNALNVGLVLAGVG